MASQQAVVIVHLTLKGANRTIELVFLAGTKAGIFTNLLQTIDRTSRSNLLLETIDKSSCQELVSEPHIRGSSFACLVILYTHNKALIDRCVFFWDTLILINIQQHHLAVFLDNVMAAWINPDA